MVWIAIECAWFSVLFEKAFVNRVNRHDPMRRSSRCPCARSPGSSVRKPAFSRRSARSRAITMLSG
jgi:hypothetical protein